MGKKRLYGLGEPVSSAVCAGKIDMDETLQRIEKLGITAFREWIHITDVLETPEKPKQEMIPVYTKLLDWMVEHDIEVTGLSHYWFLAEGRASFNEMYPRDLTPGSLYMQTLEMLERSWYTLVKLFPQVKQWEVGNEWNSDFFLHPVDWQNGKYVFTEDEKLDIAIDLLYFSAKGIRAADPETKIVCFAPAIAEAFNGNKIEIYCPRAYGIAQCLAGIYQRIKSGNFWSTNTDDYFDMLAWHPYLHTHIRPMEVNEEYPAAEKPFMRMEEIDAQWRASNDMAYSIMSMYGDGHKPVLLTEMGFASWLTPWLEAKQMQMTVDLFNIIKTMPYVKTIHFFRLYASELENKNEEECGYFDSVGEFGFGLYEKVNGKYEPRNKAFVLQKIYGGNGELSKVER